MSSETSENSSINPQEPDELFVSLEEAVRLLGSSKPTLYRWLAQGEIRGFRAGRKWRFRKTDLQAFLERRPAIDPMPQESLEAECDWFRQQLAASKTAPIEESALPRGDSETMPARELVLLMFAYAISSRSSDIHLEPVRTGSENYLRLRLRIDGALHELRRLPLKLHEGLIMTLKELAQMDVNERKLPQNGRIALKLLDKQYEMRLSCLPSLDGEELVIRILLQNELLIGIEQLELADEDVRTLRELIHQPSGLILIGGAAGSGRTTLAFSLLQELAGEGVKLSLLDEPIEIQLPYTTQPVLNSRAGFGIAAGLRAVMRHDPDVLFVGQVDSETARMLPEVSLTGHLIIAIVGSEDGLGAVQRLCDLGVEPGMVGTALIATISPRLVRKTCTSCARPVPMQEVEWSRLGGKSPFDPEQVVMRGTGCDACRQTGYRGRQLLCEVIPTQGALSLAIEAGESVSELRRLAEDQGVRTQLVCGLELVLSGITTPEEVFRVLHTSHLGF